MNEINLPNQCKENCQPQLKIFEKPLHVQSYFTKHVLEYSEFIF